MDLHSHTSLTRETTTILWSEWTKLWPNGRNCGRMDEMVVEMGKLLLKWRNCGRNGEIVVEMAKLGSKWQNCGRNGKIVVEMATNCGSKWQQMVVRNYKLWFEMTTNWGRDGKKLWPKWQRTVAEMTKLWPKWRKNVRVDL